MPLSKLTNAVTKAIFRLNVRGLAAVAVSFFRGGLSGSVRRTAVAGLWLLCSANTERTWQILSASVFCVSHNPTEDRS
jgi:hypothetical protein